MEFSLPLEQYKTIVRENVSAILETTTKTVFMILFLQLHQSSGLVILDIAPVSIQSIDTRKYYKTGGIMKEEEVSTVVGSGVHLTGVLKDQSDIVVHGSVEGEVKSEQNVIVGDSAKVKGPISAQVVSISGEVKGTIRALDKLEIHPTGRIEGNIHARDLIIHSGAYFTGKCEMETGNKEQDDGLLIEHNQEQESGEEQGGGEEVLADDSEVSVVVEEEE